MLVRVTAGPAVEDNMSASTSVAPGYFLKPNSSWACLVVERVYECMSAYEGIHLQDTELKQIS